MEGPPSFILKILTKCQDHNQFTHGTYMYELHVLCNSQIYTTIHLLDQKVARTHTHTHSHTLHAHRG